MTFKSPEFYPIEAIKVGDYVQMDAPDDSIPQWIPITRIVKTQLSDYDVFVGKNNLYKHIEKDESENERGLVIKRPIEIKTPTFKKFYKELKPIEPTLPKELTKVLKYEYLNNSTKILSDVEISKEDQNIVNGKMTSMQNTLGQPIKPITVIMLSDSALKDDNLIELFASRVIEFNPRSGGWTAIGSPSYIVLSLEYFNRDKNFVVNDTFAHEYAHYLDKGKSGKELDGHTPGWKFLVTRLGLDPEKTMHNTDNYVQNFFSLK